MLGRAERAALLADVPLLETLDRDALDELAERFDEEAVRKGDVIWREGDPADRVVIVVRGQLEVRGGPDASRVLSRVGPGGHLGELGLLLHGERTATVIAARAATLLTLGADDFHALIDRHAGIAAGVARGLGRQLHARTRGEVLGRASLSVGVAALPGVPGATLVATTLARLLADEVGEDVLLVTLAADRGEGRELPELLAQAPEELHAQTRPLDDRVRALDVRVGRRRRGLAEPLADLVERLSRRVRVVILDAGDVTGAAVAAEACDALVLVRGDGETPRMRLPSHTPAHHVVNLFRSGGGPPPIVRGDPYVLRTDVSLLGLDAIAQARRLATDRHSPAAAPLRRLARKLLGRSVGLALGGGAAFGVAHVGVLLALEEHGIEVDVLTGSSIGSIAALSYASGMRPEEMLAITRRIGHWRTTVSVVDPTVTRPGLLAGERLKAIFRPFLGAAETFEDLVLPCQTVATDIDTGERVDIASGRLIDAFRASGSVPMLWSPVRFQGRTLVDGSLIDPVPSDLAYEIGADVCIAVNVVPTLRPGVETVLTRASRWANALNPFSLLSDTREMPNILDVGMNALQIVGYELGSFKARDADVLMNVDLSDYTWVDFHHAEALVERGVEAVERALPAIREAVSVRPALPA